MPVAREVKTLKQARALRLEVEQRLVELMEKRLDQVEGVRGVPGANADLLELEVQRHVFERALAIEATYLQRRQFRITLWVAAAGAFATVVYAVTYVWAVVRGHC